MREFDMKWVNFIVIIIFFGIFVLSCNAENIKKEKKGSDKEKMIFEYNKTEEEWKQILSPEEYKVLREKGTERPYTGKFNMHSEDGIYTCKGCGNVLFDSDTKFDSHCGWPSFYDVKDNSAVKEVKDTSHGMVRTEVVCAKCGGHLGHIFEDGPNPTGLRYCINSVSIDFKSTSKEEE